MINSNTQQDNIMKTSITRFFNHMPWQCLLLRSVTVTLFLTGNRIGK